MAQPNNNQMAFWEAMKQKYERRNENLKQQEICLKQRLEQLKQLMENQQAGDDCDCVPEKLEKPSLVQCLVEKGKNLILGSCKCGDPKIGEEFLCACHITNPRIPLNVSSDLCPSTPTEDGCSNSQCDFYNQQLSSAAEDPSTFSLKTTDIYYMNKLSELVNAERCMQEKIEDLENREHSYISAIQDIQELMKKKPKEDPMKKEFNRMAEGMEEENKNLKNELENLKLELKHCFERVEGPLRRSLEEQKDKCLKMEKELKDFQTKMASKEDGYLKEINEIKAKLCQACCTMVDLNTVNSKLKDDLNSLQNKCEGLEDDLLKQQLREAENILKFKNALSRRGPQIDTLNRGDDTEQELGHIARKLSETLNEVCPCVTNVPSGLTETVQNIKQLTDLVGEKEVQRKKRKGKLQSCSCTFSANEGQQTIPTKPRSIVNCACSTSSLRLNPTTTQDIRPGTDAFQSCSSSISLMSTPTTGGKSLKPQVVAQANKELTKETTSIGCSCCEIQDACEPQSKPEPQATMKSEDTICLCPDVQSEIVGPSEEVIAVKHLGTLGVSPAEAAVQAVKMLGALHSAPPMKKKKERLQVDTTCDVLSVPAEDIHIVTTIAKTGSLEITTEGPPGIIETKVNYLADGKIEIVTKLIDHKNMETFLDGTLLHVQEEPQCNESQTCEGQCSPHPKICSDTTNCDLVNACVPECDGSEKKGAAFNLEKEKVKEPTGSVLFREKAIIPKNLSEWKNDRFDDSSEEKEPTSLVCEVEPVRRRKARLVEDVTDSNHDLPKALKLSSKPSLTDVEKYLQVESQDDSSASSTSYIYPDVLETISEGDEDEDSSKADLRNQSEGAMVIEKREELCNDKMEPLVEIDRIICDYADDESESSSAETVIEDQGSMVTGSGDAENSINKIGDTLQIKEAEETISSIRLSVVLTSSDISKNTLEEPQLDSLFEKNDFTAVNNEEKSENRLEIEDTISLCELYRNFGSVNLLRGNFQLKQSKSMFERKSYYAECLRVSKSAVLCFGNLKIDLENIKFFSGVPNVGDFDESNLEGRKRVDNVLLPFLPVQGVRTSSYLKAVEEFFAEDKREGCSCFGTTQVIPDQTYQCYVCTCSNKKDASQNTNNLRNEQNLEQRIDRLLEINPLATSHGPDCQCVDCLVHNAQSHVPRSEPQLTECKCSKRLEDIAKRIDPSKYRCKCNFKKKEEAITVKNVALIYGTPKHEGDNTQHDKNCTCVDCICNPCHFKKGKGCDCGKCDCSPCCDSVKNPLADLTLFKFQEPPEITVMNVRIPCDCAGQCLCNPCMDNSKKPQPKSQFQAKAQIQERSSQPERSSCKKCSERVSGQQSVQTKTSSQSTRRNKTDMGTGSSRIDTKPSAQDQPSSAPFSGADTWKTVVGCACVPAEEKKAVCDCKVCECKPCAYAEKARAPCDCHPPKKELKAPKGNCECTLCQCEICNEDLEITGVDFMKNNSPTNNGNICDCKLCECFFCSDPNAREKSSETIVVSEEKVDTSEEELKKFPKNCRCSKCECKPCFDKEKGGKKCDCDTCKCNPCVSRSSNEDLLASDTMFEMMHQVDEEPPRFDKIVECDCAECKCESSCPGKVEILTRTSRTVKVSKICDCSVCSCDPCNSPRDEIGDVERTPKCDCQKCKCTPCLGIATNERTTKEMNLSLGECESELGKNKETTACDCDRCECDVCLDKSLSTSPAPYEADIGNNGSCKSLVVVDQSQGDHRTVCCPCNEDRGVNDVTAECKDCLICSSGNEINQNQTPQCDCKPCTCRPCPDPNTIHVIGDADRTKEELQNVLNKICISCDRAEDNLKPLVKRASNFESTISKMKLKLMNLQQKCRDKDQIISAMTNDLRMRSESGVFADLLRELAHPKAEYIPDFNRSKVCDYLPKPKHIVTSKLQNRKSSVSRFDNRLEPILELDRYLPGARDDDCTCKHLDVSGMEILDIRRVTIDSILIKWRSPFNITGVTGYQIFVNDELKYKVLSPNRTNAVLDSLNLGSSLEIMLFAMSSFGRCKPPALATYKI